MLQTTYQVPAALMLLVGGLLACFAGYRLFRLVLAIYGFVLGALFAVALVSPATLLWLAVTALVGGVTGALILALGYFVGVALVGAGLGALVAHMFWLQEGWGDPRALLLLAFAIAGAVVALIFQRYVIIVGTAFGGAWSALLGAAATFGDPAAQRAVHAHDVWVVHPFAPPLNSAWFTFGWLVLGIVGLVVQLRGKRS